MTKHEDRLTKIVYDIYRELYKNSEPQADFDELCNTSPIVNGKKMIPYDNYEIEMDKFVDIVNNILAKHKLSKKNKNAIEMTVSLGCGPKFKIKIYENT